MVGDMTVALMMTRWQDLISVPHDGCAEDAAGLMGEYFDQLPVLRNGRICGVVSRTSVPGDDPQRPISFLMTRLKSTPTILADESIESAILRLRVVPFLLVVDPTDGQFCGLVHYADLNKQVVRVLLYLRLSALEMGLAEYLRRNHPSIDEWLDFVPSVNRAALLGDFELKRRKGIEISPVDAMYFRDMLVVLRKLPDVDAKLGLQKKIFDHLTKPDPLNEFRNVAMHPVRPIVQTHADVGDLADRLSSLRELTAVTVRYLHDVTTQHAGNPA
jgi:hypothetical protein